MKSVKNLIFLALILAVAVFPAYAQEKSGLKGKVRTVKGEGIASASITLRQNGEDIRTTTADGGGNFVLENVKPGNYSLVFSKSGYSSGVLYNVEVKKKGIRNLGDRLILNVDQGTLVIIRGSVFASDGRSIGGAEVVVEKVLSDGSTKKIKATYSSLGSDPGISGGENPARGDFVFRLPEGAAKYRVTATIKDFSASKEIEVDIAAIYRLALNLETKKD